ncbi:MAG TPA: hypothetical protein VES68_01620 [Candidatus Sulfotelmatobacter sp.]|nr:hypothetical protein [Candidatus Sulfotelmatobacter sp.]
MPEKPRLIKRGSLETRRNLRTSGLLRRENPQIRLRHVRGWTLTEENGNGRLDLALAGQMVLWEANELDKK